jgi:hypothetical protein
VDLIESLSLMSEESFDIIDSTFGNLCKLVYAWRNGNMNDVYELELFSYFIRVFAIEYKVIKNDKVL